MTREEKSLVYIVGSPETRGMVFSVTSVGGTHKYEVFVEGSLKTYYDGQISLIRDDAMNILVCLLMCFVPVFMVFAWVTAFDMENPVAKAILILECIFGIVWIWACLSACCSEVKKNHEAERKNGEQLNMHRK